LTQRLISELYQKSVKTINEHIKNIYEEGKLDPQATIRKFRIVQQEGDRQVVAGDVLVVQRTGGKGTPVMALYSTPILAPLPVVS
jgi:hypothetical protein